ncbi:MAG: DUF6290 family protein [Streptococcaceae bacterium]|nr:DUF6290 family protein [Streptococcaceae bacterium]
MPTISFRISNQEKEFIEQMAKFNGMSLSKLIRKKLLEALKEQMDMESYEKMIKLHQIKDESLSHEEMKRELGL